MNADVTFCASLFIMMSVLENATYMHQRRNFTCSNCEGLVILTCCCISLRNGTKAYRKIGGKCKNLLHVFNKGLVIVW